MNAFLNSGSIGESSDGFNFLDNVVEAMRNLQNDTITKKNQIVSKSNSNSKCANFETQPNTKRQNGLTKEISELYNENKSIYNSSKIFPDSETNELLRIKKSALNELKIKTFLTKASELDSEIKIGNFKSFRDEDNKQISKNFRHSIKITKEDTEKEEKAKVDLARFSIHSLKNKFEEILIEKPEMHENFLEIKRLSGVNSLFENKEAKEQIKSLNKDKLNTFTPISLQNVIKKPAKECASNTLTNPQKTQLKISPDELNSEKYIIQISPSNNNFRSFKKSHSESMNLNIANTPVVKINNLQESHNKQQNNMPLFILGSSENQDPKNGMLKHSKTVHDFFKKESINVNQSKLETPAFQNNKRQKKSPKLKISRMSKRSMPDTSRVSSTMQIKMLKKQKMSGQLGKKKTGEERRPLTSKKGSLGSNTRLILKQKQSLSKSRSISKKDGNSKLSKLKLDTKAFQSISAYPQKSPTHKDINKKEIISPRLKSKNQKSKARKKGASSGPHSVHSLSKKLTNRTETKYSTTTKPSNRKMQMLKYYWQNRNPNKVQNGQEKVNGKTIKVLEDQKRERLGRPLRLKKDSLFKYKTSEQFSIGKKSSVQIGKKNFFSKKSQEKGVQQKKQKQQLVKSKTMDLMSKKFPESLILTNKNDELNFLQKRKNITNSLIENQKNSNTMCQENSNTPHLFNESSIHAIGNLEYMPFHSRELINKMPSKRHVKPNRESIANTIQAPKKKPVFSSSKEIKFQTISTKKKINQSEGKFNSIFTKNKEFVINDIQMSAEKDTSVYQSNTNQNVIFQNFIQLNQIKTNFNKKSETDLGSNNH